MKKRNRFLLSKRRNNYILFIDELIIIKKTYKYEGNNVTSKLLCRKSKTR